MIDSFKQFMEVNPHYGYLIGVAGFTLILIGLILDWNWVLEPGGGFFNTQDWINTVGRKTVRIFLGAIMVLGIIACSWLFFHFETKG